MGLKTTLTRKPADQRNLGYGRMCQLKGLINPDSPANKAVKRDNRVKVNEVVEAGHGGQPDPRCQPSCAAHILVRSSTKLNLAVFKVPCCLAPQ
ncbi:unnamed protein product [Dibothriocephalus latus]|uniref:Uncharacterized protein n=1 Tax=Dibothriocephalus latus TaxID=60516 RepID=A0A3P7L7X0_DIBLA|nr:unnamed protein product [Dibothriocephalus latus]